jgi:hypothetical protein
MIAGSSFGLNLSENGQTRYTIGVASEASETEKTAARELQAHLKLVTGAEFPIQSSENIAGPTIWVGPSEKAKKLAPNVDWAALETEGIVMKTSGEDLLLAGGRPRGTLYAVYSFLEDVVGVRWWTATDKFIPQRPTLQIDSLNVVYVPQFQYREVLNWGLEEDLTFTTKMKVNGSWQKIPENYGGHFEFLGFCHTFYRLLPPDGYFAKHPEWYSLVNGKRTCQNAQLCLTNEEMRKELTRVALDWIRGNPNAGLISVSQNDCGGACECEKCKALVESEGSESGPLIHFVNAVAADIAKEYPDFKVETLAYDYTQNPPRHIKAAGNVVIRLCSTGTFQERPLTDPANATFHTQIDRWSSMTSHLFVWYYTTNYLNYIVPQPNLYNWEPDLHFFAQNKVYGVLAHGNPGNGCPMGDFVRLRGWVMAHLLWNPALDEQKLIREFLEGYYGPAASYLADYLDIIHASPETRPPMPMSHKNWGFLTLDEMNRATRIFDAAVKATPQDSEYYARLKRDRLPLDHMWLLNYKRYAHDAKAAASDFLAPDPVTSCNAQLELLNQAPGPYFENAGNSGYQTWMRNTARAAANSERPTASVPEECEKLLPTDWFDFQEDSFWMHYLQYGVAFVDDPQASNGKAISMPGDVPFKIINLPFFNIAYQFPQPVRCYVRVRCESQTKTGLAYTVGISDASQDVVRKEVFLDAVGDGGYHTIDLGPVKMTPDGYAWFIPCGDVNKVKAIYIDRIFFVREGAH